MIKQGNDNYGMYQITVYKQSNTKKIVILNLLAIILIVLILITKNSIEVINQYKIYQQYETQLVALQKQEEIQKEQEMKQSRIPQLTQER